MDEDEGKLKRAFLIEIANKPVPLCDLLGILIIKTTSTENELRDTLWRLLNTGQVEYINDGRIRKII